MDAILALALVDDSFRKRLIKRPEQVLRAFAFSKDLAEGLAEAWGIGPFADCGDTCRLTQPCGWTVCGKTTNGCAQIPNWGGAVINPVPLRAVRARVASKGGAQAARRKGRG
jgi:hypothetical protein